MKFLDLTTYIQQVIKDLTKFLIGAIFGVLLVKSNISGEKTYKASKVKDIILNVSSISCIQGVVQTLQFIAQERSVGPDCEAVSKELEEAYHLGNLND